MNAFGSIFSAISRALRVAPRDDAVDDGEQAVFAARGELGDGVTGCAQRAGNRFAAGG